MVTWSRIAVSSLARPVNMAGPIRNLLDVIRPASRAILDLPFTTGPSNIVPGSGIRGDFTGTWTGIRFGDEGYELI